MNRYYIRRVVLYVLLSLFFAGLSGSARGCHHASRDYHDGSRLVHWISADWYNGTGGKEVWNQGYPWSADFTHLMMHLQVLGLLLAGTMTVWIIRYLNFVFIDKTWSMNSMNSWKKVYWLLLGVWTWLCWWFEGWLFELWYHVILPLTGGEPWSLWRWLWPI